jgi:hypothetical protein
MCSRRSACVGMTDGLHMAKSFITGAAQGVTDSVKRVTAIMKDRPDPHAEREAAKAERKELGRTNPKASPPGSGKG